MARTHRTMRIDDSWEAYELYGKFFKIRHKGCDGGPRGGGRALDPDLFICRNCCERIPKETVQKAKLLMPDFHICYPTHRLNKFRKHFYYGTE